MDAKKDELPSSEQIVPYAPRVDILIPDEILSYDHLSGTFPWEGIYNSTDRLADPLSTVVTFPEDNLITSSFTKFHRSVYASSPGNFTNDLDPYVKVCFDCFSTDWNLLRSRYYGYTRWRPEDSINDLPLPIYTGDKLEEHGLTDEEISVLESGGVSTTIFEPYNKCTNMNNKMKRANERLELFEYYDPHYDWQPGTEVSLCRRIRKNLDPSNFRSDANPKPYHFTITPKSIAFQMGELEPFFSCFTLYQYDPNTREVAKLSEHFHFQLNSENTLRLMDNHWDPLLSDKNNNLGALFSVTRRNEHVYLVLEVTKILQGAPEVALEPYAKLFSAVKVKDQEKVKGKIKNETADYCSRLGKYRQSFAFSILKVFDAKGDLLLDPSSKFENIYLRNHRDTTASLVLAFVGEETKKLKDLHAICYIEARKFQESEFDNVRLLDPSLQVCKNSLEVPDDAPLLKEIHEFLQVPTYVPNFYYVNNMFISLVSATIGYHGKNITVKMEVRDSEDPLAPPIACIANRYSNTLIDQFYSSVHYHTRAPAFNEQIKLVLPPKLTQKHHLLFTFYHIIVAKKKKVEDPESLLGYAVVPLYSGNSIVTHNMEQGYYGTHIISKLDPGYVDTACEQQSEIPLSKASFLLRFHLDSTIFPEDKSITEFLNIYHTTEEEVEDKELVRVLRNLEGLSELLAIQYLPVIINNLIEVMVTRVNNKPQFEAFKALVMVMHKVKTKLQEKDVPRNYLLELYSNYIFQQTFSTKHSVYEALCSNFLLYMMERNCSGPEQIKDDSIFVNSWFIFDLIIKSMALKLQSEDILNAPARKGVFNDVFVRTLSKLLTNLAKYFEGQKEVDNYENSFLNKNLALFMNDLFSVFDRGIVLDMVRTYLQKISPTKAQWTATAYTVQFLRIIVDNEHYVPLNLPFIVSQSLTLVSLSQAHPVAYTLLFHVYQILISHNPAVWDLGISVLYDIIVKNSFDERYSNQDERERVAGIYFIIIPMFLDHWEDLTLWKEKSTLASKREFYICILYVLKSCDRKRIRRWWIQDLHHNQLLFLELLDDIIEVFDYHPDMTRETKTLLTPQVALFLNKAGTKELGDVLRQFSEQKDPKAEAKRLRLLTLEVHTLLLDITEDFINDLRVNLERVLDTNPLMTRVVQLLCTFMQRRQSFAFVHLLYDSLRAFVYRFSSVLFKGDNIYLTRLLTELLFHCNVPEAFVHLEASALLFIILKLNQRSTGNNGRTKVQLITTLSNLVQSKRIERDVVLQRSFMMIAEHAINAYSTLDLRDIDDRDLVIHDDDLAHLLYSDFARGTQELSFTLTNTLRDTLRVIALVETADSVLIADLYFQIAEEYTHTPDLRIVWLQKLGALQEDNGHNVEAGMAYTHASALILDYLISSGKLDIPIDIYILETISPNIKEFSNAKEEGVCQSQIFSVCGLINIVQRAIYCFKKASYYEFAAHMFTIITPLYERNEQYSALSEAHTELQSLWKQVDEENENRTLGAYFRVGFIGDAFGDLQGQEYVYKQPTFKHILEIIDEVRALFEKRIGKPILHIDGGKSISDLDKNLCYVQITKIEPIMMKQGRFITRHTDLNEFVFYTPFTLSGKAHGDSSEQYKRKTILSVSNSFPSMFTRLLVTQKREIIITPIENAIEDIDNRNAILRLEIHREPLNPKTLTQVIQGSALPQVNEGALSVCKMFLVSGCSSPLEQVKMLCSSLQLFLSLVEEGLMKNKQMISTEHDNRFHYEMTTGFRQLQKEIMKYISGVVDIRGSDPVVNIKENDVKKMVFARSKSSERRIKRISSRTGLSRKTLQSSKGSITRKSLRQKKNRTESNSERMSAVDAGPSISIEELSETFLTKLPKIPAHKLASMEKDF